MVAVAGLGDRCSKVTGCVYAKLRCWGDDMGIAWPSLGDEVSVTLDARAYVYHMLKSEREDAFSGDMGVAGDPVANDAGDSPRNTPCRLAVMEPMLAVRATTVTHHAHNYQTCTRVVGTAHGHRS
jgi:hypothetical protein